MIAPKLAKQLGAAVAAAETILLLQPEKPDGDSLATCLALEEIWGEMGKNVIMYSRDEPPEYIRVLDGWDRLSDQFPAKYDLAVLVDTGSAQMIARTLEKHQKTLSAHPLYVIDHHGQRSSLPFESVELIDTTAAATGEMVWQLAQQLGWPLNAVSAQAVASAVLSDTQNLTLANVTAATVQVIADAVAAGANLHLIHQKWRERDALTPELLYLKGKLLERVKYHHQRQVATAIITPAELKQYAEQHDPADLIVYLVQAVKGVKVVAILRDYGTKIKGSLRANLPVASLAAAHFGGGGHPRAAGLRVEGRPVEEVEAELVKVLSKLIDEYSDEDKAV